MTINNSLVGQSRKPRFSVAIQSDAYKNLINQTLGDKDRSARFIAAISSAVAVNPALQNCDAGTIISGALVGESLNLSPSNQLGHYYLVPFEDRKNDRTVATFQIGYKGLLALAMRSGQYKRINVLSIKKGELVNYNPLTEELNVNLIEDDEVREKTETIGYYAMFELVNGYQKSLYWSKDKMEKHANRYSKGYQARKGFTFWEKDFDSMAYKTLLRQLISKWGIMSIELETAYTKDMSAVHDDGKVEYVDNDNTTNFEQTSEPIEVGSDEQV